MDKIGDFLRAIRKEKGLSLREAAKISGISHSYIRYVETDKRPGSNTPINPTPEVLQKMADAYGYPYEKLMERAGYIKSKDENVETSAKETVIDLKWILNEGSHVVFEDTELNRSQLVQISDIIKVMIRK